MTDRTQFEHWLLETHALTAEWQEDRNCYKEFAAHLAWCAWHAREDEFREYSLAAGDAYSKLSREKDAEIARLSEAPTREQLLEFARTILSGCSDDGLYNGRDPNELWSELFPMDAPAAARQQDITDVRPLDLNQARRAIADVIAQEATPRHYDQQGAEWHCLCGEPLPDSQAVCPKCTPCICEGPRKIGPDFHRPDCPALRFMDCKWLAQPDCPDVCLNCGKDFGKHCSGESWWCPRPPPITGH